MALNTSQPPQTQSGEEGPPPPRISYEDAIATLQSMFPDSGWSADALGEWMGMEGHGHGPMVMPGGVSLGVVGLAFINAGASS